MTATLTHPDIFGEVIHAYSRAQALADGVLVDITPVARKMGFNHPVAVTQSVWLDSIYWDDSFLDHKTVDWIATDTDSRLHEVVWMALVAARACDGGSRTEFSLMRVPIDTPGPQAKAVTLVLSIGPGDDLSPVITISMPGED